MQAALLLIISLLLIILGFALRAWLRRRPPGVTILVEAASAPIRVAVSTRERPTRVAAQAVRQQSFWKRLLGRAPPTPAPPLIQIRLVGDVHIAIHETSRVLTEEELLMERGFVRHGWGTWRGLVVGPQGREYEMRVERIGRRRWKLFFLGPSPPEIYNHPKGVCVSQHPDQDGWYEVNYGTGRDHPEGMIHAFLRHLRESGSP